MKHFLHIGLGNLFRLGDFILQGKSFQFDKLCDLKHNAEWKIWAEDCKWYSEENIQQINNSDWIDEFIYKDICDDWPNTPLFDEWDCNSVMEHVKKEDAQTFVKKLRQKVANDSIGYVHIDLSDHSKGTRSLELFKDSSFASTYPNPEDKKYWMYCNRINGKQWKEYFSQHFIYNIRHDKESYITFDNVRPRYKD